MLKIENGVISLNRGDDVSFFVNITDGAGGEYVMESGDELRLSVKKTTESGSPVLLTTVSPTNLITITHDDTKDMDVGKYSAAIRLNRSTGEVIIIYPSLNHHGRERAWNNFVIDPEVVR